MPAAARVSPCRVRTMLVGPRRATTRSVSPASASSRVPARSRPSALLTTLLVTATTSPSASVHGREQQGHQVVAGAHLGDAVGRQHPQLAHGAATRSIAAAAIAAVASGDVIIRGTARHATPAASTSAT